jgi:hypothetical protein
MEKFICEVCGQELPEDDRSPEAQDEAICPVDVCQDCHDGSYTTPVDRPSLPSIPDFLTQVIESRLV